MLQTEFGAARSIMSVTDVEAPRFQDSRHLKVVGLSDLRIGRFYPPGNNPGTHLYERLSRPQGPKCDRKDYVREIFQ